MSTLCCWGWPQITWKWEWKVCTAAYLDTLTGKLLHSDCVPSVGRVSWGKVKIRQNTHWCVCNRCMWWGCTPVCSLRGVSTLTACIYLDKETAKQPVPPPRLSGRRVSLEDDAKISVRKRELLQTAETPHEHASSSDNMLHDKRTEDRKTNCFLLLLTLQQSVGLMISNWSLSFWFLMFGSSYMIQVDLRWIRFWPKSEAQESKTKWYSGDWGNLTAQSAALHVSSGAQQTPAWLEKAEADPNCSNTGQRTKQSRAESW